MPKTVLRIGAGVSHAKTPELGYLHNTLSIREHHFTKSARLLAVDERRSAVTWPIASRCLPRLPSLPPPVAIDRGWEAAQDFPVEHRDTARNHARPGGRSFYIEPRRLVAGWPPIDVNSVTPDHLKTNTTLTLIPRLTGPLPPHR
jgi:hypothetical protein